MKEHFLRDSEERPFYFQRKKKPFFATFKNNQCIYGIAEDRFKENTVFDKSDRNFFPGLFYLSI